MRVRLFVWLVLACTLASCRTVAIGLVASGGGTGGAVVGWSAGKKYPYTDAMGNPQTSDQRPWFAAAGFVIGAGIAGYVMMMLWHPEAIEAAQAKLDAERASGGSGPASSTSKPSTNSGDGKPWCLDLPREGCYSEPVPYGNWPPDARPKK